MIVIAGLPSSGNHIVFIHVRRGVAERDGDDKKDQGFVPIWHGDSASPQDREFVQIWHGDNESPNITRHDGERLMFVIPVRNEAVRKLSVSKRVSHPNPVRMPLAIEDMRRNVVRLIVANDAPWYAVSYEGLVADPERAGRDLFEWLGLPWVPWPGKGEGPKGPVYDANTAHKIVDIVSTDANS